MQSLPVRPPAHHIMSMPFHTTPYVHASVVPHHYAVLLPHIPPRMPQSAVIGPLERLDCGQSRVQ